MWDESKFVACVNIVVVFLKSAADALYKVMLWKVMLSKVLKSSP